MSKRHHLRFQLDRMEVPVFYTPIKKNSSHRNVFGKVFTESSEHISPDWITIGHVSKQSPLGQGTFLGFPTSELRKATTEETLAALKKDHPFGKKFKPGQSMKRQKKICNKQINIIEVAFEAIPKEKKTKER